MKQRLLQMQRTDSDSLSATKHLPEGLNLLLWMAERSVAEQQVLVQSELRLVADTVMPGFPLTDVYLCHFTVVSPVPDDHMALELQDGTKTFQPGSSCSAVSSIISALSAPSELPVFLFWVSVP